jgi:hypothetical protein
VTSHIKMLLGCGVFVAFGFIASISYGQTKGPAALAAKQAIKNQVVAAMDDGKISQNERRDILLEAKDVCTETEYQGLIHTMNRLSPPDQQTPENLGHAKYVDKQFMAAFPSGDLPYIDSLPSKLPIVKDLTKRLAAKETMPQQSIFVKEIETIVKQPIVKKSTQMQSVVKTATPKQNSTMAKTSKQTILTEKTAKQSVKADKSPVKNVANSTKATTTAKVVILPSPTQETAFPADFPVSDRADKNTGNKMSKSEEHAPPMPNANKYQPRNDLKEKPVNHIVVEGPKKQIGSDDQVSIQQPNISWKNAEQSAIRHTNTYTDYSVPVLNTPTAALLTNDSTTTIQASFDGTLEPESRPNIIR